MPSPELLAFIQQSNAIEGMLREPTDVEIHAHEHFLSATVLTSSDLELFVSRIARGARLREIPGMDVRVGMHLPPRGGPRIRSALNDLLYRINEKQIDAWSAHVEYETLHPFMDGNGRSGRVLWLRMRQRDGGRPLPPVSFLHAFYYETLQHARTPDSEDR